MIQFQICRKHVFQFENAFYGGDYRERYIVMRFYCAKCHEEHNERISTEGQSLSEVMQAINFARSFNRDHFTKWDEIFITVVE